MILTIAGTDRSALVSWQSVTHTRALTNEPDFLSFSINIISAGQTYKPAINDVVELYDGATLLFAGKVLEVGTTSKTGVSGKISVKCKDYTLEADRRQVVEDYAGETASDIVLDLVSRYMTGITTTGVQTVADIVTNIRWNYVTVTQALQELCQMTGCEWWIDYNKDLVFQKKGTASAPFSLLEDKESFIYNSFSFTESNSQVRNAIYVRGGEELYSTVDATSEKYVCDGQQRIFPLGQKYENDASLYVGKSTGGAFSQLTVGEYGVDDAASFNCLYDFNNRSLVFPDATKPAATNILKVYGNYYLPVIVYQADVSSVANNGLSEWRIIDKTIRSRAEARQRAQAELLRYSEALNSGSFSTYKEGLEPGMVISVNLPTLGVIGAFYIKNITTTFIWQTGTILKKHNCTIVGTDVIDSISVLLQLLVTDKSKEIEVKEGEILDSIYWFPETITATELFTALAHPSATPTFQETAAFSESTTLNPIGTDTEPLWYAGPYFPTSPADPKRQPRIDAGLLVR